MKILIRQVDERVFQLHFQNIYLAKSAVVSVGSQGDQHCLYTIVLFTLLVHSIPFLSCLFTLLCPPGRDSSFFNVLY